MYEAYSQEVASVGYWPGGAEEGIFYAYARPGPAALEEYEVEPTQAYYDTDLGEFVLPYQGCATRPRSRCGPVSLPPQYILGGRRPRRMAP